MDALRARGMRFTDMHAAASVCTPSRASLLTGRLGARNGVTHNFNPHSTGGLPLNETTLAEVLRGAGYATAMAGKWHLGHTPPHSPPHRGFDRWLGTPMSHDYGCTGHPGGAVFCPHAAQDVCFPSDPALADPMPCHIGPYTPWALAVPVYENDTIVEQPADLTTLADRYAAFAARFVADSAAAKAPFFLYMAWNHMHIPVGNHRPEFTNSSANGIYGDTMRQLDEAVGTVLDALDEAGVADETLVLLTGDNGGAVDQCEFGGSNGPFTGGWLAKHASGGQSGKLSTWEGGHREPGLAVWPGHIAPNGTSHALASTLDFMPTIAALAGAALPADRVYDGVDLAPVLFGDGSASVREVLFHPNSGCEGTIGDIETVRVGRYKAKYRTGGSGADCAGNKTEDAFHDPPLIFDLAADVSETDPLDAASPEFAKALAAAQAALAQLKASLAADNTSQAADYNDPRYAPCCNPANAFCVCEAPAEWAATGPTAPEAFLSGV